MREEGCRHGLRSCAPSCRGEGWEWESPGNIGFRDGPVEVCFLGRVTTSGRVEGVEYCLVVGAEIEGDKVVGSIVLGATASGNHGWVRVGGAGSCPPLVGGLPLGISFGLFLDVGEGRWRGRYRGRRRCRRGRPAPIRCLASYQGRSVGRCLG